MHVPAPALILAAQPANANAAASFFQSSPCTEVCSFCHGQGHRICECPTGNEYVLSGRATIINNRLHLPNGQPIPFDGSRRGLKASINSWLAAQSTIAPTGAQTHVVFVRDAPPHLDLCNASTSRIEEVAKSHILQVREVVLAVEDEDPAEFLHNIFEVFAAEKKKDKASKAPELLALPKEPHACPTSSGNF